MILSTDMAYCAHNLITFCVILVSASLLCCSLTASVLWGLVNQHTESLRTRVFTGLIRPVHCCLERVINCLLL